MKIGDYVRTPYGIAKIKNIFCETGYVFIETDNDIGDCSMANKGGFRKGIIVMENDYANFRENNVKQEPIDLIEEGDYVNGILINEKYIDVNGNVIIKNECDDDYYSIAFENNDIKTIVTKEQFESMEYRIGE